MQTSKPIIQNSLLRVFVFIVLYIAVLLVSGVVSGIVITVLQKQTSSLEMPVFYYGIIISFAAGLFVVFLCCRFIDRRSIKSLGLQWKGFEKERISGFLTGVVLCGIISIILWLMQIVQWFTDDADTAGLLIALVLMMAVAFIEELVFRGYILNNLLQGMNRNAALGLSAIIFAVLHSLNPGFNLTAFLNILLAGLVLGVNYIFSRNLWFGMMLHLSWNYMQGSVLGFKVSGLELPTLLQQNNKEAILLTGGEFGLEASWLTSIVFALALIFLYTVFQKKYNVIPIV
jgi:membrane protease YdiL (CAAX protease family)